VPVPRASDAATPMARAATTGADEARTVTSPSLSTVESSTPALTVLVTRLTAAPTPMLPATVVSLPTVWAADAYDRATPKASARLSGVRSIGISSTSAPEPSVVVAVLPSSIVAWTVLVMRLLAYAPAAAPARVLSKLNDLEVDFARAPPTAR